MLRRQAPGLIYAGCHGPDEQRVFEELRQIVEEAIELYRQEGKPLPPGTAVCPHHLIKGLKAITSYNVEDAAVRQQIMSTLESRKKRDR